MTNPPKTSKQAQRYKYGIRYGDYGELKKYVPGHCAYEVFNRDATGFQQCEHFNGHGPDYLYCRQHAKMIERQEKK